MLKKTTLVTLLSLATALTTTVSYASSAVVDKTTCSRMANTTKPFILVLKPGDKVHETISQCAKDAKLPGASVSGLGQVHNPTLAYFTSNPNDKPTLTTLNGYYELTSLNGNVAVADGQYYTHIHATLADKQFHGIAGHVDNATTGLTIEVTIVPFESAVERTVDAKTGFGPLIVR